MKELTNNKNIIIKPADKGSAVVIMNRIDYLKEGFRQLSDNKYYTRLDHEPTLDFHKEVKKFVQDMWQNTEIDDSIQTYLMRDKKRLLNTTFCLKFTKVPHHHQEGQSFQQMVAQQRKFVDHFLNPTCKNLKSLV